MVLVRRQKAEKIVLYQTSRILQTYIVADYTFGEEGVTKVKKLHICSGVFGVDSMASEGITTSKFVTTATTEGNQQ